jgi:exodeoxyribonuclease V gamma subunit
MPIHAYRSQRVEDLVDWLSEALAVAWPGDPFEPVPIVVGSRGMERWLRHELATRLGAVARIDFVFPKAAFDGAARWLLGGPPPGDRSAFWSATAAAADVWSGPRLALRVVASVRARIAEPCFAPVRTYLGALDVPVGARELGFATQVAGTLERLVYDRPVEALAWAEDPTVAGADHAWLATLLCDLHQGTAEPSPARLLSELAALAPGAHDRSLPVFGLSTMRPGDRQRLALLARHLHVQLFALVPSSEWWQDIQTGGTRRGALKAARDPDEIERLLAQIYRQNAMLAANGRPSQELQLWLEQVGYQDREAPTTAARPSTLLEELHAWIDRAGDNPKPAAPAEAPWRGRAGCRSIQLHACHSPLRECEVLRDELLRRFASDATLEPRHVLVMTPDVASYAPLVAAVFARKSGGVPEIPTYIADLGIRSTNPLADALLQILALARERVTASRLLDLLATRPVRQRFGLAEDDLADLRAMVVESGIRWAWDADDRAHHGQPRLDQSTVRFGLERLALGVLMPDPGGLEVVPGADPGPAVPLALSSRERIERFGRLAQLCHELGRARAELVEPATTAAWRERLQALAERFTLLDDAAAWLRLQLEEQLAALFPEGIEEAIALDCAAVEALLRGAFELPQHGDRPITGAVTVCGMEPMRSVPFRIVAMVGMDDGAFPRPGRVPAWDPFTSLRPGESDRRTVDRHLFLEAIVCARDALLVLGRGFEARRGAPVPPSVVVSELAELLAAGVGCRPADLVTGHPLQPWSEQGFEHADRLPFDELWQRSAEALRRERARAGLSATPIESTLPAEEHPPRRLSASELAAALANPHKELLRGRLGLRLEPADTTVADREPLVEDQLQQWQARDRALGAMKDGRDPDRDALAARLRAEGTLPLGSAGRRALEDRIWEAGEAWRRAREVPGGASGPLAVAVEVDGMLVTAVATDVRLDEEGRRLVWVTASKDPSDRAELCAWVSLLVAVAADAAVSSAHVCGWGSSTSLRAPPSAAVARSHLTDLVRIYRRLRTAPVLLFANLSRKVGESLRDDPELGAAERVWKAAGEWAGSDFKRGDLHDVWVASLFWDHDIADLADRAEPIVALARRVYLPLLEASHARAEEAP